MELEELERAAGLDPDSPDYRLRQQLAEADDQLIEHLVQLRKDKGLTQKVVAERMKRDVAAVSNFERLRADPHLSTIRRYAAAIGASITHQVVDVDAPAAETPAEDARGAGKTLFMDNDAILRLFAQEEDGDQLLVEFFESWARQRRQSSEAPEAEAQQLRTLALKFMADRGSRVGAGRS